MAARARYSGRAAHNEGIRTSTVIWLVVGLALLAAVLWLMATGLGGELGTLVTGWFRGL